MTIKTNSILLLLMTFVFSSNAWAQTSTKPEMEVDFKEWFHYDFDNTGIFGVNDIGAHKYLKSKGIKQNEIIVAILDSGVEVDHDDLATNMWINEDEIAGNGVDDDKNGYVDDIHGWNFIGGPEGDVNYDTLEITRLFNQYAAMFEGISGSELKEKKEKYPKQYAEWEKIKKDLPKKIQENKQNLAFYKDLVTQLGPAFDEMIQKFGDQKLSKDLLKDFTPTAGANFYAMLVGQSPEDSYKGKTAAEFKEETLEELNGGVKYFSEQVEYNYNLEFESRSIVGDNYADKTERIYGNNNYEGPDARHGTHVAGLVAAVRGNNIGMDGVAGNKIKIMTVRTVPNGDERDKDVANAIRYAVDNGAKIINMSFGKAYSPEKELVWDAMRYAESKNVLLVKAAGNDNKNIDIHANFPTVFDEEGNLVSDNVITVGANTADPDLLRSSFSNYGMKGVDVFAPGSQIYSTVPDNKYEELQGTSMASPITAGVAALVWSHFPNLTAQQVKEVIMKTVNKDDQLTAISVSGGVVDALKAVQLAHKMK